MDQSCSEKKSAEHEKSSVALNSVLAAVGLTTMKLVVGVATGSLGILAEAAHSGLDLVAAIVTWIAVRTSSRPPDRKHQYGHGKIENLSALAETLLLLLTCVWIIYEASHRLIDRNVEVDVNYWSFAVMIISIVVDVSRSRMLYRAAKKHNSQALEADALHFSTDIWSSAVVVVGLLGVKLSEWYPSLDYLHLADSVAALVVALIVVYVSLRLGVRTVHGLLDGAPAGMQEKIIEAVEAMPDVIDCHSVRIRYSGPHFFVDAHVSLDGKMSLEAAHAITDRIEERIIELLPGGDVTVHPEPYSVHYEKAPESDEAK
jgi:cation diffusion facilitator family transporter